MAIDPHELVKGVTKLASLPEVCVRVNEMVDDPRCSAASIGKVITQDTALSAQLLRISNSAFFNFPSQISTISRAITVIGERELRYLVLAMSAVRSFEQVPTNVINMATFWRHSVYVGALARLIAKRCHVLHSERLFVAGLLHDVGLLVLLMREPELVKKALEGAEFSGEALYLCEQTLLGCDHAAVGYALLKAWNLPPALCDAVGSHHDMTNGGEARLDAAIIYLADIIANKAEMSVDYSGSVVAFDPLVWEISGLSEELVPELMADVEPLFAESWALIQPLVRQAK